MFACCLLEGAVAVVRVIAACERVVLLLDSVILLIVL